MIVAVEIEFTPMFVAVEKEVCNFESAFVEHFDRPSNKYTDLCKNTYALFEINKVYINYIRC